MKGKTNIHHKKPRSLRGKTNKRNCIKVPRTQHECYHLLFRNYTPEIIAEILNKFWIDPDYEMVVIKKSEKLFVETERDVFNNIEDN